MKKILLIVFLFLLNYGSFSQCNTGGSIGILSPITTWQTIAVNPGPSAYRTFSAVAGAEYTFSYCQGGGSYTSDPYLTLTDNSGAIITWNDDWCFLGSNLVWSCTVTGTYRLYLHDFPDCNNATSAVLAYIMVPPPATGLNFDGINDFVQINNPFFAFNNEITVEWWVNISSSALGSGIGQSLNNVDNMATNVWLMHSNGGNTMQWYVNDGGTWRAPAQIVVPAGWHHVTGTASATSTKIYMDGVLMFTGAGISTGIQNVATSSIAMGRDVRFNTGRFMNASMDEVRIWNRELCQSEIQNNMNCELNPAGQNGLVSLYQFNQGFLNTNNSTVTTLNDNSGNGRNGTLNNFALNGSTSNWNEGIATGSCAPFVVPTITCPGNQMVNNTPGSCNAVVTYSSPTTGTPAPTVTYTFTGATTGSGSGNGSGSAFNVGVTNVMLTATNSCAAPTCSFTVTVVDNQPPTAVCQNVTVDLNAGGTATITVAQVNNGSSDNCAIASMTLSRSTFTCADVTNRSALILNAGGDGVTSNATANIPIGNSARTFSAWVNTSVPNNTWAVIHQGNLDCNGLMFGLGLQSNNRVTFWGGCRDYVSGLTVPLNQWTYVALTYDGADNYVLYMNGMSESFTLGGGLNTLPSRLFVGHETTNNGASYRNQFVGSIDDVKVYNRLLTPAEIATDLTGTNPAGANLVLYYPFSAGTGTVIADAAGTNTATLINPTGSNWTSGRDVTTTLTVTDVNGNSSTCTAVVTVRDLINPVITCPADIVLCGSQVVIYTMPTATDNCSATVMQTAGLPSGSTFPVGTTVNTFTATDTYGNTVSCSFNVIINPIPTVNTQPNQTVCPGTTTTATFSGSVPGTVYNWTNTNTAIGLGASGTGNISFTSTNAGLTPITGTIVVTPTYTNAGVTCTGATTSFTITVNPTPTVNQPANQSLCPNTLTAPVNFTGAIAGTVYNWTNTNTSIGLAASGTGNIAAFTAINNGSTAQVATITVTPAYTVGGTTCTGTARTFTITVTPNPPLTIVADPGTIICEGDPTLLTVRDVAPGPGPAVSISHSSSNTITAGNSVACNAGTTGQVNSYWRAYNLNNFPAITGSYTITSVRFGIEAMLGGASQNITVKLYNQTGAAFPGGTRTQIASQVFNIPTQQGTLYTATFTTPVTVPNTSTVIVEVTNETVVTGVRFFIGSNAAAETDISYLSSTACGINAPTPIATVGFPNMRMIIGLNGTLPNVGPQSTGTFLWSPAAGLSSTTSNPVAASPMNTTTYKVVRTTVPGGCKDSATITITVNKRPVVSTQPVNRTNCVGTTATFTVAGTGTALTYQWQVSTTGPGGPWTNLANAAPYSGVTTTTLTVNPVGITMNGYVYRCVLSGTCAPGIPALNISNGAVLTVNALPVVTIAPAGPVCGGVAGISGTALTASGANTYVWTPNGAGSGLFTNTTATTVYTGTNLATVYAAPTAFTAYTVTGTSTTTGCSNTASVLVNYTPPAPTVTPSSVAMCLGDPAVRLVSSSSTTTAVSFPSGTISVPIPDNTQAGVTSTITVAGIPAAATIGSMSVNFNMSHTWAGDIVMAIKAPNNNVLNLNNQLSGTGGAAATTGFVNTTISSTGTALLSSGTGTFTGTFRADALAGAAGGPTGMAPTGTTWGQLYGTPNGVWTLGMYDNFVGDVGTLTSWTINMNYVLGVPSTSAVWTPAAGLFTDALATVPYVAGTRRDTVWTRPTPSGVYPYQVTVNSLGLPATEIQTTFANNNAFAIVTSNFRNNNAFPVIINGIESVASASGGSTARLYYKTTAVNGAPGAISAANGWILAGTGTYTAIANTTTTVPQSMLTGLSLIIPAGATYGIAFESQLTGGAGNLRYSTVAAGTYTDSNGGCDLLSGSNVSYAGDLAPNAPTFTPRAFIGKVLFSANFAACTSPARTVVVTVNQPTTVTTQPVNRTICTDKVATFTVAVAGTGPYSYQWQVSTNNGNPIWSNVPNTGVYSGATTATLTVTAPPVIMSGYQYRVIVTGAAPCAAATSNNVVLTVNPLPTVIIAASPHTSLFPGLTTTLSSTVTPGAASTYTWLRNGSTVPGAITATLRVDVDGMGVYQLRVTDLNGCTNTSNMVTIKDSVTAKCFIYPNPTDGRFQVRYHSVSNNILPRGIVIYDAKGDRVLVQNYAVGRPYDRMDVDMRAFGKGLYWVEIVDQNGSRLTMCRVVIQ